MINKNVWRHFVPDKYRKMLPVSKITEEFIIVYNAVSVVHPVTTTHEQVSIACMTNFLHQHFIFGEFIWKA